MILELSKEINNLDKEKAKLASGWALPTKEMIDVEATKGVEHTERTLKLGMEIMSLEELHDRLRARLDLSKSKLEEFKSQFVV